MVTLREISNGQGLLLICSGDLDLKDLYEAKIDLPERFPNIRAWYFAILDLSAITNLTVSAADLDRLVEQDRQLSAVARPGLVLAIIARGELPYGVSRLWQSFSDPTGWESEIFRERTAAENWLRHRLHALLACDLLPLNLEASSA